MESEKIRLNLGSGNDYKEGWVNIDLTNPKADISLDVRNLDLYEDNSVDEIYVSHLIEHFWYDELPALLGEWKRILKLGGILKVRCPNFESRIKRWLKLSYRRRWWKSNTGISFIFGRNIVGQRHYNLFTPLRLQKILEENGFQVKYSVPYPNRASKQNKDSDILAEAIKI